MKLVIPQHIANFWKRQFSYDPCEAIDEIVNCKVGTKDDLLFGMRKCYEYFKSNKQASIPPLIMPDFEFPEGVGEEYRELADALEREILPILESVPFANTVSRYRDVSLELAISFLSNHLGVLPLLPILYLTPRRQLQGWNVVPFAAQRDFGLVFSNANHPLSHLLNSQPVQKTTIGISERFDAYFVKGTQNFLAEMVSRVTSSSGKVFSREGYIQNEIIFEALSKNSDRKALTQFASSWSSTLLVDESQCPIFPACTPGGKVLNHSMDYKQSALVFDIGNVDVVTSTIKLLRKAGWTYSYTICKVQHEIDIPVGLGYSHLSLPYLLYKPHGQVTNLLALRQAALKTFFIDAPAHWLQHYSNHGMNFGESIKDEINVGRCKREHILKGSGKMHQSTFISYGGPDEKYAEKLDKALRERGIDTWFSPRDAVPGDKLYRVMREVINNYERVIVICSEQSLDRSGVLNELEKALEREASEGGSQVVIPLAIDDYLFRRWQPSDNGKRSELLNRVVADFKGVLPGTPEFDSAVDRIVRALRI